MFSYHSSTNNNDPVNPHIPVPKHYILIFQNYVAKNPICVAALPPPKPRVIQLATAPTASSDYLQSLVELDDLGRDRRKIVFEILANLSQWMKDAIREPENYEWLMSGLKVAKSTIFVAGRGFGGIEKTG